MTFKEKYDIFTAEYALYNISLAEQEELFNLLGSVYKSNKRKNPDLQIKDVADKLLGDFLSGPPFNYLTEVISIHTLAHIEYGRFEPTTLGLKSIEEIKQRMSAILDNWLPF